MTTSVTESELTEVCEVNALFDAHADDSEFGHQLLVDGSVETRQVMALRGA